MMVIDKSVGATSPPKASSPSLSVAFRPPPISAGLVADLGFHSLLLEGERPCSLMAYGGLE